MNVQEALDESFYWLTTNPQSRFSNFGDKYLSIIGRVSDQIFRKTKGLYYLTNEPIFKLNWGGDLVSSPGYVIKDSLTDKHSDGSWENLYYKVYICKNTFAECFYIKKDIDSYYLKEFCVDRTYFYYIFYTVALLLILGILLFLIILVKRK